MLTGKLRGKVETWQIEKYLVTSGYFKLSELSQMGMIEDVTCHNFMGDKYA